MKNNMQYIGDFAIYKGKENYKKINVTAYARYRKYKKKDNTTYVNKYYVKVNFGTIMVMNVEKKKIKLKQRCGDIDGMEFNGIFKLVRRHSTKKDS